MDLSVQKMQPPAKVQGKSAAKKSEPGSSDEAVGVINSDQAVKMDRGNAGYEERDQDEQQADQIEQRQGRRKNRQLISQEGLSELTGSLETTEPDQKTADGLLNMRAYQAPNAETEKDEHPHFEVNI